MKRLHHFIALILSVALMCLSTGMSRIHLCSPHCCKDKTCQMQSHSHHIKSSCCTKKQGHANHIPQEVSPTCSCISILYKTDVYLNHTDVTLPEIVCTDLSLQTFIWYFLPKQNIKTSSIFSHAPPLTSRSILSLYSILII